MVCPKFNVRGSLRRQKNLIHAYPIIIAYLCKSHMLRFLTGFFLDHQACYTRIFSPKKSRNKTRKKNIIFFHVCLISPVSCWHVTRLSRPSVRLMNERQSLHHSQFKVVCVNFFRLWLLKHWKIRIAYRQWRSKKKGKKTKIRKEKPKVTYSVTLVMAFLAA